MPSKTNSTTSKGLPKFKEKLSNLVRQTSLRGYAKKPGKSTIDVAQEPAPPKERVKKRGKAPPAVKTEDKLLGDLGLGDFKPFDFDFETLESFRLSEGWLESQQKEQPSSTPIADTFSRNSIQVERPLDTIGARTASRPVELPTNESRVASGAPAAIRDGSRAQNTERKFVQPKAPELLQTTQARHNVTVPSRASSLRREIVSLDEAMKPTPRHTVREVSLLKPVGYSENPAARTISQTIEQLNSNKRYSMPASLPSELGNRRSVTDIKDSLASRSTLSPQDKRLSLQPTSPASIASASSSSQPPLTRRASSRLASDRLAWIKELEEGKNSGKNPGRDFVLKNLQGGVADKLAKFEGKQLTGGLTRTNSTISRMSSADAYGIESSFGSIMTRTSTIDTSNRASSVLTNFDDSFREKMETLAGTLASKANEGSTAEDRSSNRATSKFVPVTALQIESITKSELPKEVTEFAMLSDGDPETVINDITRHGNLGRTLTWNETDIVAQINDAADRALTESEPFKPNTNTNTISPRPYDAGSLPVTKRSTSIDRKSAPSPIPTGSPLADSPPRKTKNSNMSINVAAVSPATPTRIAMDINSPPCAATFSTLSSEAIPLAKDEHTPGMPTPAAVPATPTTVIAGMPSSPKRMATGGPAGVVEGEGFNAASLPVFAQG